ncbi:MAG TPA: hypothetical protein VMR50_13085 [Myxococcota bacterium]|nr:hypothetical protein [Myxococcota bacterium]
MPTLNTLAIASLPLSLLLLLAPALPSSADKRDEVTIEVTSQPAPATCDPASVEEP